MFNIICNPKKDKYIRDLSFVIDSKMQVKNKLESIPKLLIQVYLLMFNVICNPKNIFQIKGPDPSLCLTQHNLTCYLQNHNSYPYIFPKIPIVTYLVHICSTHII